MIDILMATYNGEKYIKEQIESILNQTFKNFRLIIRDDCSRDKTLKIIKSLAISDKRIYLLEDDLKNLGVVKNFQKLLEYTNKEYIMFSDQDDIWLPQKIKKSLKMIEKLKKENKNMPILVHTNAKLVDKTLKVIKEKLKKNCNLLTDYDYLFGMVQGATVIFDKSLKKMALDFPKKIYMHDHYLSIVANEFGVVGYIDEPLILYRQHDNNVVGAGVNISQIKKLKNLFNHNFSFKGEKTLKTVEGFNEKFRSNLEKKSQKRIDKYLYFQDTKNNKIKRILIIKDFNNFILKEKVELFIKILFQKH